MSDAQSKVWPLLKMGPHFGTRRALLLQDGKGLDGKGTCIGYSSGSSPEEVKRNAEEIVRRWNEIAEYYRFIASCTPKDGD